MVSGDLYYRALESVMLFRFLSLFIFTYYGLLANTSKNHIDSFDFTWPESRLGMNFEAYNWLLEKKKSQKGSLEGLHLYALPEVGKYRLVDGPMEQVIDMKSVASDAYHWDEVEKRVRIVRERRSRARILAERARSDVMRVHVIPMRSHMRYSEHIRRFFRHYHIDSDAWGFEIFAVCYKDGEYVNSLIPWEYCTEDHSITFENIHGIPVDLSEFELFLGNFSSSDHPFLTFNSVLRDDSVLSEVLVSSSSKIFLKPGVCSSSFRSIGSDLSLSNHDGAVMRVYTDVCGFLVSNTMDLALALRD